mmetsp:Transcript_7713/g.16375  ORF Transcript_7713/g.16375 Transcript_7713/m.16375 type:complete len:172 (-) Transcript_7713:6-521(-)|eukprot:s1707_g4.t1
MALPPLVHRAHTTAVHGSKSTSAPLPAPRSTTQAEVYGVCLPSLIVAVEEEASRMVFMSHAKRLGLDDHREAFYLDDLLSALRDAQTACSHKPLLLLLGEDSWQQPAQAVRGPRRPYLVKTSCTPELGLCCRRLLPSSDFGEFEAVVAECVVDFEEACASGAWLQQAEAYL